MNRRNLSHLCLVVLFLLGFSLSSKLFAVSELDTYVRELYCVNELVYLVKNLGPTSLFHSAQLGIPGPKGKEIEFIPGNKRKELLAAIIHRGEYEQIKFEDLGISLNSLQDFFLGGDLMTRLQLDPTKIPDLGIFLLIEDRSYYYDLNKYWEYRSKNPDKGNPTLFLQIPDQIKPLNVFYWNRHITINGYVDRSDMNGFVKEFLHGCGDSPEIVVEVVEKYSGGSNDFWLFPSEKEFDVSIFEESLKGAIEDQLEKALRVYVTETDSDTSKYIRALLRTNVGDLRGTLSECLNIIKTEEIKAVIGEGLDATYTGVDS